MRIVDADMVKEALRNRISESIDECINNVPTVDVLDKIRAEIADLDDAEYEFEGYYKAVNDALQIIDKYKAESEDKE